MKRLEALQKRFDLKRRFPGYFSVWVFRVAFFVLGLLVVLAGVLYGFEPRAFMSCPDGGAPCMNLLYECRVDSLGAAMRGINCAGAHVLCDRWPELCAQPFILPGQSIGSPAPSFLSLFGVFMLIVLAASFGVNHLIFRRTKKL
jgi:hypothetical protein